MGLHCSGQHSTGNKSLELRCIQTVLPQGSSCAAFNRVELLRTALDCHDCMSCIHDMPSPPFVQVLLLHITTALAHSPRVAPLCLRRLTLHQCISMAGPCCLSIVATASSLLHAAGHDLQEVVEEVRRQFADRPGIMTFEEKPDYAKCVAIVAASALKVGQMCQGSWAVCGCGAGIRD